VAFAHGRDALDASLVPGTALDADLVFYPGAAPLRALVKHIHGPPTVANALPGALTTLDATAAYARALASQPWLEQFPLALGGMDVLCRAGAWRVRDQAGHTLPLAAGFGGGWTLLALAGGHPIRIFGEWDGERLFPLSVEADGRLVIDLAAGQTGQERASR
jgi:hypothetical protein